MKFALFTAAIASVACYTKQVSFVCNSGSSVNSCVNLFRNAFPGSSWSVQRIMGKGTWNGSNPPTCAALVNFYNTNCLKFPLCPYDKTLSCLPIDPINKN